MKDIGIVHGSATQAVPLVIGYDKVYVHTDIKEVDIEDGAGGTYKTWQYHEVQYGKDEYIQRIGASQTALVGTPDLSDTSAAQLRRSMQMFVEATITDESQMMEVADLYPTWEELLATKKEYPAGKIFKWRLNADGEPQLWSFISAYTPQEIYPPDKDISHYKKVGITEDGTPVWTQPLGATDAYNKGDVVSHKGKIWTSDIDGNVWEPGVYGWEIYSPEPEPGTEDGSKENPFTASRGITYTYGKYYRDPDDGKTYLCKRTGEAEGGTIELQYLPHELIGQYFEEVV